MSMSAESWSSQRFQWLNISSKRHSLIVLQTSVFTHTSLALHSKHDSAGRKQWASAVAQAQLSASASCRNLQTAQRGCGISEH
jgi:hypothetical protein